MIFAHRRRIYPRCCARESWWAVHVAELEIAVVLFLCLWLYVRLVEVGIFFNIGKSVDLESMLGIEWVIVHGGESKISIFNISEFDKDESEAR